MKAKNYLNILSTLCIGTAMLCACGGNEPENITPGGGGDNTGGGGGGGSVTPSQGLGEDLKVYLLNEIDLTKDITPYLPHGNYSGITPISDTEYAIVDDMAYGAGFIKVKFEFNANNGRAKSAERTVPAGTDLKYYDDPDYKKYNWNQLVENGITHLDAEGIIYYPAKGTVFVACEEPHEDPRVLEFTLDGEATGRQLEMPDYIDKYKVQEGFGLESLAYNAKTGLFWTTTEQSLTADVNKDEKFETLRLMCFDENLKYKSQYLYHTDEYRDGEAASNYHIWGVSGMLALDDGRVIVMERDFRAFDRCLIKLYVVNPTKAKADELITKKLIYSSESESSKLKSADYEGICLGPKLSSGTQTLLLIADSNNGSLYDALKVLSIE